MKRLAFVPLLMVTLASEGAAQGLRLTGAGTAAQVGSRMVTAGTPEDGSGIWAGGRIGLRIGRISLEGSGLRGSLTPATDTSGFERVGGEMRADLSVLVGGGFAAEAGYTIRAFDSPAGYQKWTMTGVGASWRLSLGSPSITGYLRTHYLAGVSLEGGASADLGLRFEGGFAFEPARGRVVLAASYRFERFDFAAAAGERLEHFDVLGLSIGLRL